MTYGHWTKGNHIGMFGNMQPMGSCDWVRVHTFPAALDGVDVSWLANAAYEVPAL
jgi:hypothetical protein